MRTVLRLFVGLLLFANLGSEALAQTLRLRNGKFLVCRIMEVDEEKILVKHLKTGGEIELRWEDLFPADAERLRTQHNLLGAGDDEAVLIRVIHIRYSRASGGTDEVIGELVSRDPKNLVLRRKKVAYTIPVSSFRGAPQPIDVPIQEILTPDEIYQRKLEEVDPGEDPDKHALLGGYYMRVDLLEEARTHLFKARELGGGAQSQRVEGLLKRVEELLAHKAEADLLAEIQIAKNRKNFKRALELCSLFETTYPESPLKSEFESRKATVLKARESWFVRRVALDWYDGLLSVAGRIAADKNLSIDAAQQKAESEMSRLIQEKIAKKRELAPEEVKPFFDQRMERKVFKPKKASYGFGTWILGKADILKDTAQGKAEAKEEGKKKGPVNARDREFQKRLREFLRKARGRQGGKTQEASLETPDQWWKRASTQQRKQWLVAYYAEKAGDMDVYFASLNPCPTCHSRGFLEIQETTGGKVERRTCPTCHGERFQRVIRFR